MDPAAHGSLAVLAEHLEVLASPTRLELLHTLRTPQPLQAIRVAPSFHRLGERPERPLTRQAVAHHVEQLLASGFVQRVPGEGRGEAYVLDPMRLFALVDEIRGLARLRPVAQAGAGDTVSGGSHRAPPMPDPPRLVVAFGREDGVAFSLAEGSRWRIGRSPPSEVCLEYDPFLSGEHALLERRGDRFSARDLDSRNGTFVNWERLARGEERALRPGDIVAVGRSVLALQVP